MVSENPYRTFQSVGAKNNKLILVLDISTGLPLAQPVSRVIHTDEKGQALYSLQRSQSIDMIPWNTGDRQAQFTTAEYTIVCVNGYV